MNERAVVFDVNIPQLNENKLFNPLFAAKVSHTLLPFCYLSEEGKKYGLTFITPDVFLKNLQSFPNAVLMSHLTSPDTQKIIEAGAKPAVLFCQESPYIATGFYAKLKRLSSMFKHSFVFSGMKKRLSKKTIYHPIHFVQQFNFANFTAVPFEQKKFATMISGNKKISNWKKDWVLKFLYGFNVSNIYQQRFALIYHYQDTGRFDLYGVGWDKNESAAVKKVYKGKVEDKTATFKNYKFAFCFENSVFPGYVTEKILDAMYSGCVPVYLGAPNVADFVSADSFINAEDFENFEQLDEFLQSITQSQYNKYIEGIRQFLISEKFKKFTQEYFASVVLPILKEI